MDFSVLIPARLASTRLPRKPLVDLAGIPMVVRVAQRAALSGARQVVVAADDAAIMAACEAYQIACVFTQPQHLSGSDRLAEACHQLGLAEDAIVVNVQGDEPLIEPALIRACADLLVQQSDCMMSTVAHPIDHYQDLLNPNVVKVVLDQAGRALYFSRAPMPWARDSYPNLSSAALVTTPPTLSTPAPLRHIGLYGYRAGFLKRFSQLAPSPLEIIESLEQLRVLWHGERIAVHVTAQAPATGVDTPEDLARVRQLLATQVLS